MSRKPFFASLRNCSSLAPSRLLLLTLPKRLRAGKGASRSTASLSAEMLFAMHTLARPQGRSMQTLMAEALNDVLRKHGESPICD